MFNHITKCLCCNSKDLKLVLDLGKQPLANSYHDDNETLPEFPLAINLCKNCFHLQLTVAVNPDLMFKNYLYTSGTSNTLDRYFNEFAKLVKRNHPQASSVLDIACNDGSQLNHFKSLGFKTYGIDPAENLYDQSTKNGHNVYCDYFNSKTVLKINEMFDIILAQNVFAHNSNPLDFLLAAKKILKNTGTIYIQTSQANMILNNEFDTIYHEHISFFNVNSMDTLCKRAGLNLVGHWIADIHGGSHVFQIDKIGMSSVEFSKSCESWMYNETVYKDYAKKCLEIKKEFISILNNLKGKYHIVGYGAAAKGNTFLNFSGQSLDFIVDDNKLKWNLLTPGSNIKIFPPLKLKSLSDKQIVIVPLAWNFFNEIKEKVNTITESKNLYLKYFPKVEISFE